MSTLRISALALPLAVLETGAAAQTPAAPEEALPMIGMERDGAVQPIMDQEILAHVIFSQLEGRFNGTSNEFRWEGQGWVGTDYDKLWIKSEGTVQSNGTVDDGQQQLLYSRAISTYFDLQGACVVTSIRAPPATGPLLESRAWRLISSISSSRGMSAARAIWPPSWRPHTTCSSRSG